MSARVESHSELDVRPSEIRFAASLANLDDPRWESHLRAIGDSNAATTQSTSDAVEIAIGPDGQLVCVAGSEQLRAARNDERIRANVVHRHPIWMDFLTEVWAYAVEHDDQIYNIVDHPDLSHIPAMHGWDRFEMVRAELPFESGTALDIGTHWGFWCQQLEKIGFESVGLELDPRNAYFAEQIRRATSGRYRVQRTSLFDHPKRDFDLVIALYVFHHLTKTEAIFDQLVAYLRSLRLRAMVFGCHNQDQKAMKAAYRNFSPDEWMDFLIEHSSLTRARHIGTEAGRREIYLLEA
jgi:2-polyprenyl-3-methyl-5-hydroxy-6-metoxy-1,4-benzoquinol methylase